MFETRRLTRTLEIVTKDPEYRMVMLSSCAFFALGAMLRFSGRVGPPLYSDIINVFWYRVDECDTQLKVTVNLPLKRGDYIVASERWQKHEQWRGSITQCRNYPDTRTKI